MPSPACDLKFCGAWAQLGCVIVAHSVSVSGVTLRGDFGSTSAKQSEVGSASRNNCAAHAITRKFLQPKRFLNLPKIIALHAQE